METDALVVGPCSRQLLEDRLLPAMGVLYKRTTRGRENHHSLTRVELRRLHLQITRVYSLLDEPGRATLINADFARHDVDCRVLSLCY